MIKLPFGRYCKVVIQAKVMPEPRCGMPGRLRSAIFLRTSRFTTWPLPASRLVLLACGVLAIAVFLFVKDVTTDNNLEGDRGSTLQMQGVSLQYQGPART